MKKKVFLFSLFVIAIMFSVPSFAVFEISDFSIDANVLSNGDMIVKEKINYYTDEEVNGLIRDIDITNDFNVQNSADSIILQSVYVDGVLCEETTSATKGDNGVYTSTASQSGTEITLYSPFTSDHKVVEYYYVLKNVAVKYNDTAELFWNFIGSRWDSPIKELTININLPEIAAQDTIWVYGHGSDNGSFQKSENHITLKVNNVLAHQAIDARILFTKVAINESTKVYSENVLNDYINEEEGMSQVLEVEEKVFLGFTVREISLFLSAIILIVWVFIYIFFDKEIRVERTHYFREMPYGLEPEVLQYIYYGKIRSNTFYVAVLNLIKLGVYKIENTVNEVGKVTQKIIYNPDHNAKLKEYQQEMVKTINGFLEADAVKGRSIDLLRLATKMNNSTGSGYRKFIEGIKTEKESLVGKPYKAPASIIFCCIAVMLGVIALIAAVTFKVDSESIVVLPVMMIFISFVYSLAFGSAGGSLFVIGFLIFHSSCFFGAILGLMIATGVGWLFIPYLLTFMLIQYVLRIKKFSKEERQIIEYTNGLKRYIKHYSMLGEQDEVVGGITLWEDYFIMAIALGLNSKTLNYFYDLGQSQMTYLSNSFTDAMSYRDFNYSMSTPFYNYSKVVHISYGGGSSSSSHSSFGSSHSGSSGGFSGGSSSGGRGGRRWRWKPFLKKYINADFSNLRFLHKKICKAQNKIMKKENIKIIVISLFAGMISGFFSSGGGMLLVPFFTHIIKLDEVKARGTSVFCIVFFVVTSSIFYIGKNYVDYGIGIKCAIGGVIRGLFWNKITYEN